ncbi:MAG: phosphomethylpyrimidine synthase ThiC [Promethearchaeia archaeon]
MTILENAQKGKATDSMLQVAKLEKLETTKIIQSIAKGKAVIMKGENCAPVAIGTPFRTKINVNLGTSPEITDLEGELQKVKMAEKYGADTISDLSMGGNIDKIRKEILKFSNLPITTVPIYQAVVETTSFAKLSEEIILKTIKKQIHDGISSVVLHAGFTLEHVEKVQKNRIMGMVSKGGSFTASFMKLNSKENPFFTYFDSILEMLKEHDVVLNLGNAMRSGCIHDRVDKFHLNEIKRNSKLAERANKHGIQVILENLGGHLNAKALIHHVKRHKKETNERPLFVSGPLPIDNAVGYDHISAAIGGAFASGFGADYLCSITPAEHLGLPSAEDVKEGVIACRIAAHVGDSMKFGLNHLFDDDLELAKNRYLGNWKKQFDYSINPEEPRKKHDPEERICSMCGRFCALNISRRLFNKTDN